LLERQQSATAQRHRTVISVITYYEMLLGTIARSASPDHAALVEAFVARLSAIVSWDRKAAEEAVRIRTDLPAKGTPIGGNNTMIAGHAIAADCGLITNNARRRRP
jgi:tRNA(fMet)-specific endonuclease VapC